MLKSFEKGIMLKYLIRVYMCVCTCACVCEREREPR
jgi:hypothetical protein